MKKYLSIGLATFLILIGLTTFTASAATSGPSSASILTNDISVGTINWTSVSNAQTTNSQYSSATLGQNEVTHYLKATNFGFSIPAGSTINGISVTVVKVELNGNTDRVSDNSVRIVKNGVIVGPNKAISGMWGQTVITSTYGSSTDLWGSSWNASDINGTSTGVVFSAIHDGTNNSRDAGVDSVKMTVYYTAPKIVPTIVWTSPSNITYGTALSALQFNATTSPTVAGTYAYAQSIGQVLNAGLNQVLTVLFIPSVANQATYSTTTATTTITVNKANQIINWTNPTAVAFGTFLSGTQLNATTTVSGSSTAGILTYVPTLGSQLNMVGTTTLLVNAAGTPNYNAASSSVQIYVYDNIAPVISAQTNLTKEATSSNGASVTFSVISTDNVDGTLPAACSPISGSVFSIGSTTVNCLATDSSGNIATSTTFIVNVVDTTAPIVGAASDVSVDTASSSVTVTYTIPTASDLVDGASDVVSCIPESGSSFAVGSHSVTCSATDTHGNKGTSSFNVIVSDTGAPVLTIPGDISNVEAVGTTGAVVSFNASAVDSVDGATAVVCTPSSGSTFALGNTVVTCTSQDSVPNIATGTFTVNVVDTTAPVISINGNSVENVVSGHSYTDAGASSTDAVDGDISSKIVVGNNVNTSVVGAYLVTYNVSDSHGNAAVQVSRTVNVLAAPPTTGNIRVVKIVQNSNGSTTEDNTVFTVGITGGETTATSTLAEGEDANFIDLSSATYTVTEATSSDYDTLSIFPNNFNLTLGSTTVVTVINRQHVVATSTPTTTESVDTATSTDNIIIKNVSVTGGGRKAGGRVLGASTYVPSSDDACIAPLKAYMRIGKKNDSTEVTKLQNFLNDNLGLKVPVTGYFGTRTESAVKAFQLEYSSDILGPWVKAGLYPNMNIPTGYVYKTTLWKINQIACPTASSSAPEIK